MKNKISLQEIIRDYDPSNTDYIAILYAGLEGAPAAIANITRNQNSAATKIASKGQWLGGVVGAGVAGGAGAVARMAFTIITVHERSLCLYILNGWSMSMLVEQKVTLPYANIIKFKIGKFLIWTNLKLRFLGDGKEYKLNIKISRKVALVGNQKQNIEKTVEHLNKIFI